jgi:hypothetical protein
VEVPVPCQCHYEFPVVILCVAMSAVTEMDISGPFSFPTIEDQAITWNCSCIIFSLDVSFEYSFLVIHFTLI